MLGSIFVCYVPTNPNQMLRVGLLHSDTSKGMRFACGPVGQRCSWNPCRPNAESQQHVSIFLDPLS
jgi:hypothetical protein